MDSVVSTRLERSLLKVSKASNADAPVELEQVCTDITFSLSDALSDYHMFKARRDDSLKALKELASPKAQKNTYLTQYQSIKSSRDQNQQRQTQLTTKIGLIYEEIAKLQAKSGVLEPKLAIVTAHIKAEDAHRIQLYTQANALDSKIVPLAEK